MRVARPADRAFTLIELLVVVAIIALLVSILLPSLARARKQAKLQVCASNLHQLGLAMSHYTSDNKDHFPSCSPRPQDASLVDSDGWPVVYNMVHEYGGNKGKGWANRPAHKRVMYKYLAPQYFQCPEDRGTVGARDFKSQYEATGNSYPLNGYNHGAFTWYRPRSFALLGILYRKASQVTNPKCIISGDASFDEFFGDIDPGYAPNPGGWYRWHDGKKARANVVFADASVRYVLITPSETPPSGVPRSLWWWEGQDYSFCPMGGKQRLDYPQPFYVPGS
jgi:prepilin-type N-terminal cleavage/methylation domain-containing protein/prepilin-type processing-associated H-X9-DG protein